MVTTGAARHHFIAAMCMSTSVCSDILIATAVPQGLPVQSAGKKKLCNYCRHVTFTMLAMCYGCSDRLATASVCNVLHGFIGRQSVFVHAMAARQEVLPQACIRSSNGLQ